MLGPKEVTLHFLDASEAGDATIESVRIGGKDINDVATGLGAELSIIPSGWNYVIIVFDTQRLADHAHKELLIKLRSDVDIVGKYPSEGISLSSSLIEDVMTGHHNYSIYNDFRQGAPAPRPEETD